MSKLLMLYVGKLTKWYAVANTFKIHQLKTDLAACKWGSLEVVEEENHKQVKLGRDNHTDGMAVFVVKDHSAMVEKPTCKQCGKYGHEETTVTNWLGIHRARTSKKEVVEAATEELAKEVMGPLAEAGALGAK